MLFSVITVTRNNLQGLESTGASLAAQQSAGVEWMVIDGASEDGSVAWLAETSAKWISEPDHGIYDAMNKGIAQAHGEYLLFLNAGDQLAENSLQKLERAIGEEKVRPGFIYGDSFEEREHKPPAYKKARSHTGIAKGMFTHHQAMLYRRELINDLRFDISYEIAADYKFTALFLRQASALYCPFPICIFEAGGTSQKQVAQGRLEQFLIRRELEICSVAENLLIRALQVINMVIRRHMPNLYWKVKSGKRRA